MPFRWIALALAAGCAHQAAAPVAAPKTETAPAAAAEENPHEHGEKGASEPIALPHHLVDGKSGARLDALDPRLRSARVIYVGEEHPNPHDHAAQIAVLEAAFAVEPKVGLGLEMLPRSAQPALDAFVAGKSDEAQLEKDVDWPKAWGYPFGLYAPLLRFCRDHKLRVYALNAPRALVHTVAMKGLDALAPDEKTQLPEMQPGPAPHREMVREAFAQHPKGKFADAKFERFYLAQLVWDETMATSIASALAAPDAPRKLVVVAGEGHVRRFAVPDRAARRGAKPYLTIFPVFADDADDAVQDAVADLVWVHETP
jgi:uncharacterized iron-regulated protein